MPARAGLALLLSGVLSIAAIAVGIGLIVAGDLDPSVALVLGASLIALGAALLAGAIWSWLRAPGLGAQLSCIVWAGVLLFAGAGLGGATNVFGVPCALLAVGMGALSVWVPR